MPDPGYHSGLTFFSTRVFRLKNKRGLCQIPCQIPVSNSRVFNDVVVSARNENRRFERDTRGFDAFVAVLGNAVLSNTVPGQPFGLFFVRSAVVS